MSRPSSPSQSLCPEEEVSTAAEDCSSEAAQQESDLAEPCPHAEEEKTAVTSTTEYAFSEELERLDMEGRDLLHHHEWLASSCPAVGPVASSSSILMDTQVWIGAVMKTLQGRGANIADGQHVSSFLLRKLANLLDALHILISIQHHKSCPAGAIPSASPAHGSPSPAKITVGSMEAGMEPSDGEHSSALDAIAVDGAAPNSPPPESPLRPSQSSGRSSGRHLKADSSMLSFALASAVQEAVGEPGVPHLLAKLVKYINATLSPKGEEPTVLQCHSHMTLLRCLPLALYLLLQIPGQEEACALDRHQLECSFRLIHGFPTVPGHAGRPLLVSGILEGSPLSTSSRKGDGPETSISGKMAASARANYELSTTMQKTRRGYDEFFDRFTQLAIQVTSDMSHPDWASDEALAVLTLGLQLADSWCCRLTAFTSYKEGSRLWNQPSRYTEGELSSVLEVLARLLEVRQALEKAEGWLTPLVTRGVARQLSHFLSDTIPGVQSSGAAQKAQRICTSLLEAFEPWCQPGVVLGPERTQRSQSMAQSLRDLTTLLRAVGSNKGTPLAGTTGQSPATPLSPVRPQATVERRLFSGSGLQASLKTSLASAVRASAKAMFHKGLPALPAPKPSAADPLPYGWESLLPIAPEQMHLLCFTVEDLMSTQSAGLRRIFIQKERLDTSSIRELSGFLERLAQWEGAQMWVQTLGEVADVSHLFLSEVGCPEDGNTQPHVQLPKLLSDMALTRPSCGPEEVSLLPAAVYFDTFRLAQKQHLIGLADASSAAASDWYQHVVQTTCEEVFKAYNEQALHDVTCQVKCLVHTMPLSAPSSRFAGLLATKGVMIPSGEEEFDLHVQQGLSELFLKKCMSLIQDLEVDGARGLTDMEDQYITLRRAHELLSSGVTLPTWRSLWEEADSQGQVASQPGQRASRLAAAVTASLLDGFLPSASYSHATQRLILPVSRPFYAAERSLGTSGVSASRASEATSLAAEIGVPHICSFLRMHDPQAGTNLLSSALEEHLLKLIAGELQAGITQLQSEIPRHGLQSIASATGLYASKQDLLSATLPHFEQVLTAGGLHRLSPALRKFGCGMALLHMLDIAAGLEATSAALLGEGLNHRLNGSGHTDDPLLEAGAAVEAAMTPLRPSRDVMQHLKVSVEEQRHILPMASLPELLSLVLLATCIKSAGKPVGASPERIDTNPLLWGVSGLVTLTGCHADFALRDIVLRISQLQSMTNRGGKEEEDILASLTVKSEEAQRIMSGAFKVYEEDLSTCARQAWQATAPLTQGPLSVCL